MDRARSRLRVPARAPISAMVRAMKLAHVQFGCSREARVAAEGSAIAATRCATIALLAGMMGCGASKAEPLPPPAKALATAAATPMVTAAPTATVTADATAEPAPIASWKAPPPVPALAASGARAYVADATGLVEVAAPGGSQVLVSGQVSWCNTDARGQVVWYLQGGVLYTFDLVDRRAHQVLVGPRTMSFSGPTLPIITWGKEQLGGESRVDYALGIQLSMIPSPKISASLGCDGDLTHYCYADGSDRAQGKLTDELLALKEEIEHTELLAPDYLAALGARGAKGSLWSPKRASPAPPKKKPKVDKEACDADESRCGQLEPIPASPLWKVIVGNSRGDFYHQSDALWDPATGEFLTLREGQLVRSKTPDTSGELGGLRVSATGVLSMDGAVFDADTLHYAPKGDAPLTCGWSDGGYRLRGPRGG
jgi:hypothetical protein